MTRTTLAIGALVAAVSLAACGSNGSGAGRDVASLGTTPTSVAGSTPGDEPSTDPQQAMLDYTDCMRDHGIDMPDPQFASDTGSAGVVVHAEAGGEQGKTGDAPAFDPQSQQFQDADAECQPLLADAVNATEIDPEQEAEMRQQMLDYSQCMRDHGVPDFPDPVFNGTGNVSISMGPNGPGADDATFDAANEACAVDGAPAIATKAG